MLIFYPWIPHLHLRRETHTYDRHVTKPLYAYITDRNTSAGHRRTIFHRVFEGY